MRDNPGPTKSQVPSQVSWGLNAEIQLILAITLLKPFPLTELL